MNIVEKPRQNTLTDGFYADIDYMYGDADIYTTKTVFFETDKAELYYLFVRFLYRCDCPDGEYHDDMINPEYRIWSKDTFGFSEDVFTMYNNNSYNICENDLNMYRTRFDKIKKFYWNYDETCDCYCPAVGYKFYKVVNCNIIDLLFEFDKVDLYSNREYEEICGYGED